MPTVLFIGATGHVGGAVLQKLFELSRTDLEIKVMCRSEEKAGRLVSKYPGIQTMIGDLGDIDKIEAASREADILINTSPDITHEAAIEAMLRGLAARGTLSPEARKPYYLHTSGASLIWDEPEGSKDARWWDDVADIAELRALNAKHTHAITDRVVRDAADRVHVAIVAPGFVGGLSPSLEHPTPITTPALLATARAFASGFQIAQGENASAWIHVLDLARIYMLLVDDALAALTGQPSQPQPAADFPLWGADAYYFGTAETPTFGEFMRALAPVLEEHGVIPGGSGIKSVSVTDAARISLAGPDGEYDPDGPPPPPESWAMHIAIMYGVNMRLKASRLAKLGWKPEMGSVLDTFRDVIPAYLKLEKATAGS